eukprot:g1737.t1
MEVQRSAANQSRPRRGPAFTATLIQVRSSSLHVARLFRGLGIRAGPNVNAPRTGDVLKRGDVFEASVVARGEGSR